MTELTNIEKNEIQQEAETEKIPQPEAGEINRVAWAGVFSCKVIEW
jgi:hypothetical protein